MLAAVADRFDADDPAAAVVVRNVPEPDPPDGWAVVNVRAASLNHHDVWLLRGIGMLQQPPPVILGCDAAGVTADGREVVVHAVVTDGGPGPDELLDPSLSLLSDRHPGTFAERVAVPAANLVAKPPELSFEEAACLPTAWLTAYRMLFTQAAVRPGDTVLVQGASGGLSSACIALGRAAGVRVWVTGRSEESRAFAVEAGAAAAFEPGARVPERVDAVLDAVGGTTWEHSLRSLRRGGALVVAGGTGSFDGLVNVTRMFAASLRIVGSMMGTRDELERLLRFCAWSGVRPQAQAVLPLRSAPDAVAAMATGTVRGKLVLAPQA